MRYLLIALLMGCASPAERAANAIGQYGPYCDKLGYQRTSDQWRDCVAKLDAAERVRTGGF